MSSLSGFMFHKYSMIVYKVLFDYDFQLLLPKFDEMMLVLN